MINQELYNQYIQRLFVLNKLINKNLHLKENWSNEKLMEESEELMKEKQDIKLEMCNLQLEPEKIEFIFPETPKQKHIKFDHKPRIYSYSDDDDWHPTEIIQGLNDDILQITY